MNTEFRVPPHSADAEQMILSAIAEKNSLIIDLDLRADDFYNRTHREIFETMMALENKRIPIDGVTVCEHLKNLESHGGVDGVIEVLSHGYGGANAEHYAQMVREKAIQRRLIQSAYEISDLAYNSDATVQEQVNESQKLIMGVESAETTTAPNFDARLKSAVDEIDRRYHSGGEIVGLSTGFTDLDDITSGMQPGNLILIAGRPAMGKTTLAMNIAENIALDDKLVIVFSLEMTADELTMRTVCSIGQIPQARVLNGKLVDQDWPSLTAAMTKLKGKELRIDDDARITSAQIVSRARKIARDAGRNPDLIVIDYIQLIQDKTSENETQRISDISRNLKLAARDLECPVIALSQLNRELEKRVDKRPIMSDLRSSGSLEQDADMIIMLYRDEVYNEQSENLGIAEVLIRKNRKGRTGTVMLSSRLHLSRFDNFTPSYAQPAPAKGALLDHVA